MFRQTYVVYTLLNGDIDNKKGSLDSAAKTVKKTVERRGRYDRSRMLSISRQRSSSGFGKCLAWWMWVVPWLVVLGGVEGVPGVPIPDCTYSSGNDRSCGIRQAVDEYISPPVVKCKDDMPGCSVLVADGQCATNIGYMSFYCKMSCNLCGSTAGSTGSYGPIEEWDTSLVTDMSRTFYLKTTFNEDISAWDVSKVINMQYSKFTPPLLLSIWTCSLSHFFFFFHFFWLDATIPVYSYSVLFCFYIQRKYYKLEYCEGDRHVQQYVPLTSFTFSFVFVLVIP